MEEKPTLIESLVDRAEEYSKSGIDLFKLKAIDKSANALSSVVSTIIIVVAILFITMLISIGAAIWISELVGYAFSGFFIVAAFYILVVIFLFIFKKQLLKTPLSNSIITNIRKELNI